MTVDDNNRRIFCVSTITTHTTPAPHLELALHQQILKRHPQYLQHLQYLQQRATGASSGICFYLRHDLSSDLERHERVETAIRLRLSRTQQTEFS